jgi:NADH-quinone oxidoreductase subunit E
MYETPYKILGITAGRTMGNAEVLLRECLMECEKLTPVDVRVVRLRTLKIKGLSGELDFLEDAVQGGDGLLQEEDDFEWLKEQILWADAIIFSACAFRYMPPAEVITMMNRALGSGKNYVEACRAKPKQVGLMCVGGSNTVNFNLPLQYYALNTMCRGFELVDQFYANWVRGKGYIAFQDHHLKRARQQAKRIINRLKGYTVPEIKTRVMKLNPMEHHDDSFINLEGCPVCHSTVVHMEDNPLACGRFTCAVCGAAGQVEHHDGVLTYVWNDDTVAHNRLHADNDVRYLESYAKAHAPVEGDKEAIPEFPALTRENDPSPVKPRILAFVAGPKGGTSELLARKALAVATQDGQFEGAILRVLDCEINPCLGCLVCKVNIRYRDSIDECILKDDDRWVIDKILQSSGTLYSLDGVNGFTYGKVVALIQRFGNITRVGANAAQRMIRPYGTMISAFDDQVQNATYATVKLARYYGSASLKVAEELFSNVPIEGDNILADSASLKRAENVGNAIRSALVFATAKPPQISLVVKKKGMCPSCGLNMIELRNDKTVACAECDADGEFKHIFGENDIVWDDYSVTHSRITPFGMRLHFKHIDFSQAEDKNMLENPEIIADKLAPYVEYDKLVMPDAHGIQASELTDERKMIERVVFSYPSDERFSLAIMQDIQKECGYIPRAAFPVISEHIGTKQSQLFSTATFYRALNLVQRGKHVIRICDGTACHMGGSSTLIKGIETLLGIQPGQTTEDGLFSLELVKHVGSCALAPVILVGDICYSHVTIDKLEDIIKEYRTIEDEAVKEGELS